MSESIVGEKRLAASHSEYLRQQAEQPVDWYLWTDDAFIRAQNESKPIFLSIGSLDCRLSSLMSEESFEDEAIALFLNENFVCIKVDRQQRPDLEDVYSEAVRMMKGLPSVGPLTVCLTPRGLPFAGGNYFAARAQFSTPSFYEFCAESVRIFNSEREETERRAEVLSQALNKAVDAYSLRGLEIQMSDTALDSEKICHDLKDSVHQLEVRLDASVDHEHGGFGGAPKFIHANFISALLFSNDRQKSASALLTLDKIRCGGVCDPVDGGIFASSNDARWQQPQLQKKLVDNIYLLRLFSHGSLLMRDSNPEKSAAFHLMVTEIYGYLENRLRCSKTGMYFESEFIDSDVPEDCFYGFDFEEILNAFRDFPELTEIAIGYFGISKRGHLRGLNIPSRPVSLENFCRQRNLSVDSAARLIAQSREVLRTLRAKGDRPQRNEAILLSTNAFTVSCLLRAAQSSADGDLQQRALSLFETIWAQFVTGHGGTPAHVICGGVADGQAFADDLAHLLQACVDVYGVTKNPDDAMRARQTALWIHTFCVDPRRGTLFYAPESTHRFARPLQVADDLLPSPPAAVFASCRAFLAESVAQGALDSMGSSDIKMWEALELVAVATFARVAKTSPLSCAAGLAAVRRALRPSIGLLE